MREGGLTPGILACILQGFRREQCSAATTRDRVGAARVALQDCGCLSWGAVLHAPRREDAVPEEVAAAVSHDPMRISSVATSRRRVCRQGDSVTFSATCSSHPPTIFFCFLFTEVAALLLPLAIKIGSFRNFAGTDVT